MFPYPKGKLYRVIWAHARKGTYELLLSRAIITELGRILRKRYGRSDADVKLRMQELIHNSTFIELKRIPRAVTTDPDDDHILACAIESKAHLIVTGDKDLLRLKSYEGVSIIRPTDFVHTLQAY
jgi:putative PIN family toxin of toxin-antitoxin system